MTDKNPCIEDLSDSNVTVKENGRRANFPNPQRHKFRKIKVDNCLVKEGKRADWIVTKLGVGSVIVELKGVDIRRALEQAITTHRHPNCKDWLEDRVGILVICSRFPSFDTLIARSQEAARKAGFRLKVVCDRGDFDVESLVVGKKHS